MARLNRRTLGHSSIRFAALAVIAFGLGACVTRPDANDTDNDFEKWYVHCRMHDKPWCLGPFRREQDAQQAGWEHEFWIHMAEQTTRVDHEPCSGQ